MRLWSSALLFPQAPPTAEQALHELVLPCICGAAGMLSDSRLQKSLLVVKTADVAVKMSLNTPLRPVGDHF